MIRMGWDDQMRGIQTIDKVHERSGYGRRDGVRVFSQQVIVGLLS